MEPTLTMLKALASTPTCVPAPTLAKQLNWPLSRLYRALRAAETQGWAKLMRPGCYRATEKGREVSKVAIQVAETKKEAPRLVKHANSQRMKLRPRLWRTIRMIGKGTISDIVAQASNEAEQDRLEGVKAQAYGYISKLVAAGYIVMIKSGTGAARYMLLPDKDSGPLAPILRGKGIYDPNTRKFVRFAGAEA